MSDLNKSPDCKKFNMSNSGESPDYKKIDCKKYITDDIVPERSLTISKNFISNNNNKNTIINFMKNINNNINEYSISS